MPTLEPTPPPAESRTTCPLCGATLDPAQPDECPKCDWVSGYRRYQASHQQLGSGRDMTALLLSIVPGAGHIYKGHRLAGAVVMACALVLLLFVVATVSATAGAALLLVPIYWSAVILHAYWAEDVALEKLHSPRA